MPLIIVPPIKISVNLLFFPKNETLFLELNDIGYEELIFDNRVKQNSKFFETKFEKSIQFDRFFSSSQHLDQIKLFSVKGFLPGKEQRISIKWLAIDDNTHGDYPKYCGFKMIENNFVENKFLYNQSEICFNGDFYYIKWKENK